MATERPTTQDLENAVRTLLSAHDDPNREGLKDTPKRYVKFMSEFHNHEKEFNMTVFDSEGMDQMIVEVNIPFYSLCEHHLAPFFGTACIAYIPKDKIVGLSKLPRVLDFYARNFQNQERITKQVAKKLWDELNPRGVAVILKAQHLCMSMRGIKKHGVETITSEMLGTFREDLNCRNEFLTLIKS